MARPISESQRVARERQRLEGWALQSQREERRRIGQLPKTPGAVVAHRAKLVELHTLVEQFGAPCQTNPKAWLSEDRQVQKMAAAMCTACPVIEECGTYAEAAGEPGGVWGGVVRVPPEQAKRRKGRA